MKLDVCEMKVKNVIIKGHVCLMWKYMENIKQNVHESSWNGTFFGRESMFMASVETNVLLRTIFVCYKSELAINKR